VTLPAKLIAIEDERRGSPLGRLIRMLSSTRDGEIINTVRALQSLLNSAGSDIHAIAEHLEAPLVTKDQMSKIYDTAYAEGIAAAESRQNGAGEFHNSTEELSWIDVALFVQRNKHHLDSNHHKFIDDMAERANRAFPREPTLKQAQYLHSLFYKIKGKT
jgi:hypothetical protein